MSDDTLINTIDFASKLPMDIHSGGHIEFHSVEPTFAGLEFFERAEGLLADFGIYYPRLLATNATSDPWRQRIDDWCVFLRDNNWMMNLSIDGGRETHDKYRGGGNWQKVIESLIKIKEYGISYGIIAVVNKSEDLDSIYEFFIDINENFQMNPVMPTNNIADGVCALFDRWISDHKPIGIEPFYKVFEYFTNNRYQSECTNICGHDIVSIAPDGTVRPCGFFWDNTNIKDKYIYGNVNTDSFDEIWYGDGHQKMIEYVDCVPDDCLKCRWMDFCRTGCSYCKHRGADKCGFIKQLLEHASWLGDN